jgi:hypothetical protein
MESRVTIWTKFRELWKYYILQSSLATAVLFVVMLLLGKDRMVVISSMGATAFIVFKTVSAQTRNVVGGHLVGLASGTIFYFTALPYLLEYALAVGIAIFFMTALDVEHPPAAGTALAVVIEEVSPGVFITIMLLSEKSFEGPGVVSIGGGAAVRHNSQASVPRPCPVRMLLPYAAGLNKSGERRHGSVRRSQHQKSGRAERPRRLRAARHHSLFPEEPN